MLTVADFLFWNEMYIQYHIAAFDSLSSGQIYCKVIYCYIVLFLYGTNSIETSFCANTAKFRLFHVWHMQKLVITWCPAIELYKNVI